MNLNETLLPVIILLSPFLVNGQVLNTNGIRNGYKISTHFFDLKLLLTEKSLYNYTVKQTGETLEIKAPPHT